LLGIRSLSGLQKNRAYGSLFENWIITEIKKNNFNAGQNEGMYYFRDNIGNEVDLIIERDGEPMAIEIKSSAKVTSAMFRGLHFWQKNQPQGYSILLHRGTANGAVSDKISIVPWTEVANL
jgi:hypothetical protein